MNEFIEELIKEFEKLANYSGNDHLNIPDVIAITKMVAKDYNNGWIPASQPPEIKEREDGKTEVVIVQLKNGEINGYNLTITLPYAELW